MNAGTCDAQCDAQIDWSPSRFCVTTITTFIVARDAPELFTFAVEENRIEWEWVGVGCGECVTYTFRIFLLPGNGLERESSVRFGPRWSWMAAPIRLCKAAIHAFNTSAESACRIWLLFRTKKNSLIQQKKKSSLHIPDDILCWRNHFKAESSIGIICRSNGAYS